MIEMLLTESTEKTKIAKDLPKNSSQARTQGRRGKYPKDFCFVFKKLFQCHCLTNLYSFKFGTVTYISNIFCYNWWVLVHFYGTKQDVKNK